MQRIRELIEQTVSGLGYEVVDIEFAASGLLRVFIDNLADEQGEHGEPKMIRVEDCEKVSHQLGHVLEVEEVDYSRLEISSPGMDRPLKTVGHFQRFAGQQVALKLRQPFEGQRNFTGVLTDEGEGRFGLEMTDAAQVEKGKKTKPRKNGKSSRQGQRGSDTDQAGR